MFGITAWIHAAGCVSRPLNPEDLSPDPYEQLTLWLDKARRARLPEPNAMAVCSVGEDGTPSQRMVLMKHHSPENGVLFYTNYASRKAKELEAHPKTSLLIHYHLLQRQIRMTGPVERATRAESEAYFATRPRSSQLGAWASRQSDILPDRATFEARFEKVKKEFEGKDIPCPEFWGGYRVRPDTFEFWQGRAYRLHDRFVYARDPAGAWTITRLYP